MRAPSVIELKQCFISARDGVSSNAAQQPFVLSSLLPRVNCWSCFLSLKSC